MKVLKLSFLTIVLIALVLPSSLIAQTPPVYAQEFHILWRAPKYVSGQKAIGDAGVRTWSHWGSFDCKPGLCDPEEVVEGTWRRNINSRGYPLIGPYDSRNLDVIRWQIRLAKNAGLSGLFVGLFFDSAGNFGPEFLDLFSQMLDLAHEEDLELGILDEAAFGDENARNTTQMANRAINALRIFGSHPAYLKIDNQPVYNFNFHDHLGGWSFVDLEKFFIDVEAEVGDVYWIIQYWQNPDALVIPQLNAIEATLLPPNLVTDLDSIDWQEHRLNVQNYLSLMQPFGKAAAINPFPGFDESKLNRNSSRFVDRENGNFLRKQLEIGKDEGVDFIVISSFNDWQENTNITPGWDFDDFEGDPYQYLKIIADFVGVSFTPAPLPPKESIDPLMWGKLYGIDKAGPTASDIFIEDSKVFVDVADDMSSIDTAEYFIDGLHWIRLKSANQNNNLVLHNQGDGKTSVTNKGGRVARSTDESSGNFYIYLDDIAISLGIYDAYVGVEYFDEGFNSFGIEFQSTSNTYNWTTLKHKENAQTWKTHVFHLDEATFGNGQNYGADFRFFEFQGSLVVARVGILISGEGSPLEANDGSFDSLVEMVSAEVPPGSDDDLHGIYVHGKDQEGNWGITWASLLTTLEATGVAVEQIEANGPLTYSLEQNHPNPFNTTTNIQLAMPTINYVTLKIYNTLGEEVATLVKKELLPGRYSVTWDASGLASGMYVYRIKAGNFVGTKKLMLVR